MKKYAEGGKLPQDLTDEIARKENKEDREMIAAPLRALKNKIKEDMTGGAYVGSRLNMGKDRGSHLGRMSKEDADLLKKEDERYGRERSGRSMGSKTSSMEDMGYKAGGKVSSASKRADGCAQRGKTRGKMV